MNRDFNNEEEKMQAEDDIKEGQARFNSIINTDTVYDYNEHNNFQRNENIKSNDDFYCQDLYKFNGLKNHPREFSNNIHSMDDLYNMESDLRNNLREEINNVDIFNDMYNTNINSINKLDSKSFLCDEFFKSNKNVVESVKNKKKNPKENDLNLKKLKVVKKNAKNNMFILPEKSCKQSSKKDNPSPNYLNTCASYNAEESKNLFSHNIYNKNIKNEAFIPQMNAEPYYNINQPNKIQCNYETDGRYNMVSKNINEFSYDGINLLTPESETTNQNGTFNTVPGTVESYMPYAYPTSFGIGASYPYAPQNYGNYYLHQHSGDANEYGYPARNNKLYSDFPNDFPCYTNDSSFKNIPENGLTYQDQYNHFEKIPYRSNYCSENMYKNSIFNCDLCSKKFKRLSTLKIHVFSHLKSASIYDCPKNICNCSFKSLSLILKHIRSVHSSEKERLTNQVFNSRFLSTFRSYLALNDYYDSDKNLGVNPFIEKFCFGCFTYPKSVDNHPCTSTYFNLSSCPACRCEISKGSLKVHCFSSECKRLKPEVKK
ncbi:hypothetical protein CWI36_0040p0050 [Hamiltosporidium magnivora]|uniref:C2H2-type domain-containing protein n=1 Tax=Hamiltosporidium magnivora TaxID=148818 RepID=A0A4Q9LN01_9MICR|nr:hypothetical protein CWI36_0040p0050 [Hamiltosporidium magnivora]